MSLTKRIVLTIIALVGFLTSVKLTMIYWDANFNPYALSSFCSINDLIDCDGVAKTGHSQFLGVPLALWGLFLYFVFLFFTYVDKLKNIEIKGFRIFAYFDVFKNPESYICALGIIAFLISMILAGISVFEIHKLCILCFFTYILNLLIGLIAKPKNQSFVDVFVTSFKDFVEALKVKKYALAFSALVLVAIGFLTYTEISDVMAPQVKLKKEMDYFSKPSKAGKSITGNILGDKNATLVLHEYTDYQCPFCFVLNTMTLRAAGELSNIKVVHHNLPLDMECNPKLKQQMHEGSCLMAKYAIAAGYQGKYWDMNNMLFDKEFSGEDSILQNAAQIKGLNIEKLKKDAHGPEVAKELQKEIEEATQFGIDGTPAFRINQETRIGIMPYEEFKAKLINAGAKERK